MTEDETVGWHHRLDGHEFEQALGVGDGQGGLVCCSPWGCEESDTTERLNHNNNSRFTLLCQFLRTAKRISYVHTHICVCVCPLCFWILASS